MRVIVTTRDLVASLRRRVHQELGPVQVEQVDFVACEDDVSTMAYVYAISGECVPVLFETPPFFDPKEIESAVIRGDVDGARVH